MLLPERPVTSSKIKPELKLLPEDFILMHDDVKESQCIENKAPTTKDQRIEAASDEICGCALQQVEKHVEDDEEKGNAKKRLLLTQLA